MSIRPTVTIICAHTGESFQKDKREYDRQIREGATVFYKDRKTAGIANGLAKKTKPEIRQCKHCQTSFEVIPKARSSTFCSRRCQGLAHYDRLSNNPDQLETIRQNKKIATKKAWDEGKFDHVIYRNRQTKAIPVLRQCPICTISFECKSSSKQKTCKKKACVRELGKRQAIANPNCGGETNYKRYVYKDISMDSSWEVETAQWLDTRNIKWERSRKMMFYWTDLTGNKRRYYPDFYLPLYGLYLDPKNKYLIEKDRFKIEAVMKENNITILWGLKDDVINSLSTILGNQSRS